MERDSTPQAVEACHRLLAWIIPKIDGFPRNRRFTLGERIESGLLDVLGCLIQAAYTRNKQALLQDANRHLAVTRHLWRLAMELQAVPHKGYAHGADLMVDLGRQIGGWLKHETDRRPVG